MILASTFALPPRAPFWGYIPPPLSPTVPTTVPTLSTSRYVTSCITIKVPWNRPNISCPVTSENRDEWTEAQRALAENRVVATSVDHLISLVRDAPTCFFLQNGADIYTS